MDEVQTSEQTKEGVVLVIAGTPKEYLKFLKETQKTAEQAIEIKQPYQLGLYPSLEIVHYGTFWLNGAYASPEYKARIAIQEKQEQEK